MHNKSAKDLAFDKERAKYRKTIRELESNLKIQREAALNTLEQIEKAEAEIQRLQEWVDRLLTYTELSKDDMELIITNDIERANIAQKINSLRTLFSGCSGVYFPSSYQLNKEVK